MAWSAQAQVTIPDEYGRHIQQRSEIAAGGVQFGERVDPNTGSLEIVQTDVELPGNGGAPPVRVGRRYRASDFYGRGHFNYWDMDIPYVHGTFADASAVSGGGWRPLNRCSQFAAPPTISHLGGIFEADEYWSGSYFYLPGSGEQELLLRVNAHVPSDGAAYPAVTKEGAAVRCVALATTSESGSQGEGFEVVTPDGMVYTLNQMVTRSEQLLRKSEPGPEFAAGGEQAMTDDATQAPVNYLLPRREVLLFPSQVKDRFGNTATYVWSTTNPWQLLRIVASDGRRLDFTYQSATSNLVASVSDGSRTWQYAYDAMNELDTLTVPDGSAWRFNLRGLSLATARPQNVACDSLNASTTTYSGNLTSPSGATLALTMTPVKFGRSWVYRQCVQNASGAEHAREPYLFVGLAVTSKTITGPGLPAAGLSWTYAYGTPNHCWHPSVLPPGTPPPGMVACTASSPTYRLTTMTDPDGNVTRYSFGNRFWVNEGLLLKTEYGWNGSSALRMQTTAYADPATGPYAAFNGSTLRQVGDYYAYQRRPTQQVVTTQQGVAFTWQANSFDAYANPVDVARSSTLGHSRSDVMAYAHNTALWVMSQPASSTNSDTGLAESQTDYNAQALPWKTYAFGKLQQTLLYNADGTLASVADGNNHVTGFGNWKRGIPQAITFADATGKSAVVDDLGQIASITDENGFQTKYGYDAMGRLNLIDYPDNDDVNWNNTAIAFAPSAEAKYGLPAGHWRRTESTGNARKITFYDALWRPAVQETYDANDLGNTLSQTVTRYDADGQVVYASYPQRNMVPSAYNTWADPAQIPNALGAWTAYDALGRPTQAQQNSEWGLLNTTYEYLTGFQTRVTNPRGYQTTFQYKAYDQPSTDWLAFAAQPEGTYVTIARDVFGKPTTVSVRNADSTVSTGRYYAYDQYQRLCKQTEVETSTTAFGYDDAGNLAWSATGLPWSPLAPCGYTREHAYVVPRRVDRTYDARNRLATLAFPDGQGDQIWTYTPDGLPAQVVAYNDPNHTGSVVSAYQYNKRRLLNGQGETLSQPSWYSWGIGYGYDANGSLASHAYPSGYTVTYQPNALGQPTKAGTFATHVSYYPNGAIQQFNYGNGLTHTLTQNARQLPQTSTDSGGVLSHEYTYDGNGNVAQILDLARGSAYHRSMTYDGRDRLTGTGSCSFGAVTCWFHYDYDVLDNLTRVQGADGSDRYYCYDSRWQLTNIKTGGCAGTSVVGLGYDERGNLANKNGQAYFFDYGNRLRLVDGQEYYRYDGLGRRAYAASPTLGAIFSQYSRDGQLMYQHNGCNQKSSEYVYLNGSLVAVRETPFTPGATVVKYQHTDALGTPVAVTDSSGAVIERSEYTPYGQLFNRPLTDGPGYTGHVQDAATGLTYMQQRYYDPTIGRFLSMDPVTADANTGGNFNRYWYANNNPYKFTDPDGRNALLAEAVPIAIVATLAYITWRATTTPEQREMQARLLERTIKGLLHTNESSEGESSGSSEGGRRRKNRIPDRGEPGTVSENGPGTTKKQYGPDGWVETEWNAGHGPDAPESEQDDHVHDHKPNPHHPEGRPTRQPGRVPTPEEQERFKPKPPEVPREGNQ